MRISSIDTPINHSGKTQESSLAGDIADPQPGCSPERSPVNWKRLGLIVIVLAFFVWMGRRYFDELHRLSDVSPTITAVMVLTLILNNLANGATLKLLLSSFQRRVRLGEMLLLSFVMSYVNLILPRAGLGTPAIYLKYKNNVSYARFSSLAMFMMVAHAIAIGILGLLSLGLLSFSSPHEAPWEVMAAFLLVAVGGFCIVFIHVRLPDKWRGRAADFLKRANTSWRLLGGHSNLLTKVICLRCLMLLVNSFRLYLAFHALGTDVNFWGVVASTMFGAVAILVSVTPSGIGFREAAITFSASMLGCSPAMALSAAVLDRVVITASVLLGAQPGMWTLIRPLARKGT